MCDMSNQTLKEVLYENLLAILSADKDIRINAEQQFKLLETNDEFGLHLIEISLSDAISLSVRQLSAVLLKQYIDSHWTANSDKHIPPVVSNEIKTTIRNILLKCLANKLSQTSDDKKLRSSLAYAVSTIAHYDWPEEWPNLGEVLISYLSSGDSIAVHSAMKVFVELSHEVVDFQIPSIAPLLLPKMYEIFVSSQQFSLRTRGRAVQIFTTIAETIAQMGDLDKKAIPTYLGPILPQMTEALVKALVVPEGSPEIDVGIKKDIINSLAILLRNCRNEMQKWMPQILEPVWHSLTTAANIYVKTVINVNSFEYESEHEEYAEVVDSDGEVLGFESLVFAIFDFVGVVIESPKFRKLVKPVMSELLYYVITYMQITDEQAVVWIDNPDQFIEDEDDDSYSYSIRTSALDLILSIAQEFDGHESSKKMEEFKASFVTAINRHYNESTELSKQQTPYSRVWWKIQESCLLALGSIAPTIIETIQSGSRLANGFNAILETVFRSPHDVSPFLSGRSLWTASRFAEIMNIETLNSFLQSTANSLMAESPVIRISAAKATFVVCDHIKSTNKTSLIKPYLGLMFDGLLAFGTRYSTEVLSLVLETVCILISIDKEFTASIENKVAPLAIATFLKCSSDQLLIACAQDVFAELCKNEQCIVPLQQRLVPTLVSILQGPHGNETVLALQPTSIEILLTIVRNSPIPLSEALIDRAFPALIACILNSDDSPTLQNGGECVRAFVVKSVDQVFAFKVESDNQNGLSLVLKVCHHLLDPRKNESCSAFVGRLVTVLITRANQYIGRENSHLLLRAVLVKLHIAEALSVVESLILVFAHLIYYDLPAILEFLSSLPAPTGSQSALEFVLINWLNRQHLFFGSYENKVSILALCKLLQHSILHQTQDSNLNLNYMTVPGDAILSDSTSPGVKTRSKTANTTVQWSVVPCSVKILKLLIAELKNIEEQKQIQTDSDDDDEEDDDLSGSDALKNGISASKLNSNDIGIIDEVWAEGEGDINEDDILNEEIGKLDLEQYLTNVLREFKSLPFLNDFAAHLTDNEKIILNKI
ncbi:importin-9-like [Oppia nitens]|uniref:importin-9-like n=1 Tax=Oppia nitens TaxID=1686743 RepID=UPI0023D997DA|nr:importin-9-like [Oppia nitens]